MDNRNFVFFDIDNTIYDYYKGTPDSTREAIRLLRENGHVPVLCTGRTRIMIFQEILDLGFDGIVAGGGTYVEFGGKQLYRQDLPKEEIVRLIKCFRENGFSVYPEGAEHLYFDPEVMKNAEDETYRIYQMHIPDKLLPIEGDGENVIASKVSARYQEGSNPEGVRAEVEKDYICVNHFGVLYETIPRNSSKGIGIRKLIEALGADMEHTYAYGDSFNDYEMLKTVKYGVVMENGDEELKKLIPLHAAPMFEDGVYKSLKSFGLI